ncbi:rhodanese-like domain-containing protein [Neolewinella lacunae]|uniref:Rhodanese-like domain-containing protein n=1 Tax=Neolewinella lacunae TaxID=1517758 RepID=A0A923PS23_9BACT|nr:rhodanese-like domain-containing protein [Neolewinella lacunae]MBC6996454.1 rhodanese-like domain-containing protein [Neolewinella lacunae]MDN3633603.1 rhodanese-like domain-containing protein [Neolewinella lacunae]
MILRFLPLFLLLCLFACGAPADSQSAAPVTTATETPPPVYQDLSPAEFAQRIGDENTVLLDVRTPAEIAAGKIDGAVEMDLRGSDFAERLRALDPTKTYLVYCAVGGRSAKACTMLNDAGFERVYNLRGGYAAWKEE